MSNVSATVCLRQTRKCKGGGGPGYLLQTWPTVLTDTHDNRGAANGLLQPAILYAFCGFSQGGIADLDPVYGRGAGRGAPFRSFVLQSLGSAAGSDYPTSRRPCCCGSGVASRSFESSPLQVTRPGYYLTWLQSIYLKFVSRSRAIFAIVGVFLRISAPKTEPLLKSNCE